jgi:hypothetical protein
MLSAVVWVSPLKSKLLGRLSAFMAAAASE